MNKKEQKVNSIGVIDILNEEFNDFEEEVEKFRKGEWNPVDFMAFRLRHGVYGQRQPDVHMLRIKAPFGGLSADQLDVLGDVAEKYAPLKKGHITTRENFQFHHIPLKDTPDILRLIGEVGLSTREACGNTVRNVTGCFMAGVCDTEPFDVTPYAAAYARYFVRHPFTQALPRKIKTAFSDCEKDCSIVSIHDVGFIPKLRNGAKGFQMVVGGGTSIMPRIAPVLYEFVSADEYLKITEAVLRVFHCSDELRKNRMKARIKFLIDKIGIDEFRDMVELELKEPWAQKSFDPSPLLFIDDEEKDAPSLDGKFSKINMTDGYKEWLSTNVDAQRQKGYKVVTVKVPLGDLNPNQFRQLANISRKYAGGRARITQQQNLAFRWVPEGALGEVWSSLKLIGLADDGAHTITDVVSCPGTDSCKMGITSSMGLGNAMREIVSQDSLKNDPLIKKIHVKMSGCPNGCGQHHIADIGFHGAVAKAPGGQVPAYEVFIGGSYQDSTRIGLRTKTKIPAKMVPSAVNAMLIFYRDNRNEGEEFTDFVDRTGLEAFDDVLGGFKNLPELNKETITTYIDWNRSVKYQLERGEGECAV